jgi:hypothetical protein
LERHPGFAHATRAGQGHEAYLLALQEMPGGNHLLLPPDQRGRLDREIVERVIQSPEGREVGRETCAHNLKEMGEMLEVFEAMLSQIAQAHLSWQLMLDQVPCGLGEQHLPPVPGTHDACSMVYI